MNDKAEMQIDTIFLCGSEHVDSLILRKSLFQIFKGSDYGSHALEIYNPWVICPRPITLLLCIFRQRSLSCLLALTSNEVTHLSITGSLKRDISQTLSQIGGV